MTTESHEHLVTRRASPADLDVVVSMLEEAGRGSMRRWNARRPIGSTRGPSTVGRRLALYLAGIAFVDRVNEGARNGAVLPARLGAAALLLGLSFAGSPLSPLAFIASVVAVLLALTAFETLRPSPRFPAVPTPGFGTGTVPGEFWQSS